MMMPLLSHSLFCLLLDDDDDVDAVFLSLIKHTQCPCEKVISICSKLSEIFIICSNSDMSDIEICHYDVCLHSIAFSTHHFLYVFAVKVELMFKLVGALNAQFIHYLHIQ